VKSAVDNSYNVIRTRIDQFGVAQPNIQTLEGQMGRIMVEMPGIKEPDRIRKLLQGSANLEFWETYDASVIVPQLTSLDTKLAALNSGKDTTAKSDSAKVAKKDGLKAKASEAQAKADLVAKLNGKGFLR
jgi:SecD/SecF fusion protein